MYKTKCYAWRPGAILGSLYKDGKYPDIRLILHQHVRQLPSYSNFHWIFNCSFSCLDPTDCPKISTVLFCILFFNKSKPIHHRKYKQHDSVSSRGSRGGGPGGPGPPPDPRFWGPKIEHFAALFNFSIIFFASLRSAYYFFNMLLFHSSNWKIFQPRFARHVFSHLQVLVSHILGY